jgi:hypothetical protein
MVVPNIRLSMIRICFEGTFPSVTHSDLFLPFEDELGTRREGHASHWQITPGTSLLARCQHSVSTDCHFLLRLDQQSISNDCKDPERACMLEFERMLVVNG